MLGTFGLALVIRQAVTLLFSADAYVALPLSGSFSVRCRPPVREQVVGQFGGRVAGAGGGVADWCGDPVRPEVRAGDGNVGALRERARVPVSVTSNKMTSLLGCGLAGLAGALVAPLRTVFPGMGTPYLVGAFLVVILAGLGNVRSTVIWSILIGLGTAAVAIPFNDIVAQVAIWGAALVVIALRRESLATVRV